MKKGAGKAKGSSFERKIAKALSMWLTAGQDDKQLIRSVLSGGWQGAREVNGWRQVGDLAPNGPVGERFRKLFAVECKHRRDINLYGIWTRGATAETIVGWWAKLITDSKAAEVSPMLIFCSNCMPVMVGMLVKQLPTGVRTFATFTWKDLVLFPFDELVKLPPEPFLY